MTTTNPFQAWMDALGPRAKAPELGAAANEMLGAWTDAWQSMLKGRVLPAMELMNPMVWAEGDRLVDALERAFGTPQWSDLPSLDTVTLQRFAPAVELAQVSQLYASAMAQLSFDICATFQARTTGKGLRLDGSGEALDLWNATVDEKLIEFNRSETFATLQRRFLRSLMAWRLEQRWLGSRVAEHFQLPTRDEVDELARRIHDLERENRKLRRSLAAGLSGAQPREAAPPGTVREKSQP